MSTVTSGGSGKLPDSKQIYVEEDFSDNFATDEEWEYEYDHSQHESFLITLDLNDALRRGLFREKPSSAPTTSSAKTPVSGPLPNPEDTTDSGPASGIVESVMSGKTSVFSALQVINLASVRPLIALNRRHLFTGRWNYTIGTDLYFTTGDSAMGDSGSGKTVNVDYSGINGTNSGNGIGIGNDNVIGSSSGSGSEKDKDKIISASALNLPSLNHSHKILSSAPCEPLPLIPSSFLGVGLARISLIPARLDSTIPSATST